MESALAVQTLAVPAQKWSIGFDDLSWFEPLPNDEKQWVRVHLAIFSRMAVAKSLKSEAEKLSREHAALGRGFSAKALQDKYRKFRQSGCNPRSIVRNWTNGGDTLPDEFLRFWGGLAGDNKRDDGGKGAYRRLINEFWARGEHIPGYGTWKEYWLRQYPDRPLPRFCPIDPADLPRGWSYDTLMRHLPRRSVIKSMRRGFKAAHDYQKHLKRDRRNLKPMQLIAIDDFWLDQLFYSRVLGLNKPCRAVGILARDVATGKALAWFVKPRSESDYGAKQGIKQGEVRELIRQILVNYGLPPYPITFLVENASASISAETERLLAAHYGERLQIERTGVFNDLMLANGFPEKGGKPWEKSWVESFFRLLHTTAGHLPGQTGPRYDKQPGNLPAISSYTERMLSHPALNQEDIAKLRLPMLALEDAVRIYGALIDLIDHRTDHRMQGFDKITLWRTGPGESWRPEADLFQLTEAEMQSVEIRTRLESSAERWQRLCPPPAQWSRVPESMLWFLLPAERERPIRDGSLTLHLKEASHEALEYWEEGSELLRRHEGRKVCVHFSPDDPSRVSVTTPGPIEQRRFLGSIALDGGADITDPKAIGKAMGAIHRDRLAERDTVREIQADEDERLARDRAFNAYLIEQAQERQRGNSASHQRLARKASEADLQDFFAGDALALQDDGKDQPEPSLIDIL